MFFLHIHDHATDDLKNIHRKDRDVALRLAALIEQIRNDQDLLDRLTQDNYGQHQSADFHVIQWYAQQHKHKYRNLWRIKDWDLYNQGIQYRIVYAFIPMDTYHILAIVHRKDLDYNNENKPITKRIIDDYDEL